MGSENSFANIRNNCNPASSFENWHQDLVVKKMSPLYARYNGAMLGYFLSGAMARYAKSHYPVLQQRMNQFLEEMGGVPILPP
jgi:hypothetical protein